MKTVSRIRIKPGLVVKNGATISQASIPELYREICGDYPKFFKMDNLCKLGFLGAEILLKDFSDDQKENMAVILFNKNGSLITDRNYQSTIQGEEYFPSPAIFVYTLANIVTGEIAIRHKIYGETSFYIMSEYNEKEMDAIVESVFLTSSPENILTGWVDFENSEDYLAEMKVITK